MRHTGPIVFAYDFPHKKSQDVILRLVALGRAPQAVLAAPVVQLGLPRSVLRVKPRHEDLLDLRALTERFGIEYHVVDHTSDSCLHVLDLFQRDVGIVAGARVLPAAVIERFPRGIINFHPGILPLVRGLDALQWAIYRDQPLGVTAHLIDSRVDAGWILERREIDEFPDDTLIDVSLRLYETQLCMLDAAVDRALTIDRSELERVTGGIYNRSFPADLMPQMLRRFQLRRERLSLAAS